MEFGIYKARGPFALRHVIDRSRIVASGGSAKLPKRMMPQEKRKTGDDKEGKEDEDDVPCWRIITDMCCSRSAPNL
jgi:hypothetical protein